MMNRFFFCADETVAFCFTRCIGSLQIIAGLLMTFLLTINGDAKWPLNSLDQIEYIWPLIAGPFKDFWRRLLNLNTCNESPYQFPLTPSWGV